MLDKKPFMRTDTYINISGYKFIALENLADIQRMIKSECVSLGLKGTILLSHEGINIFVCGLRAGINAFYAFLPQVINASIDFKESVSDTIPFKWMKVKIKNEIITMGVSSISPIDNPAPSISPELFKQWQDEGKEMVILDTRNDYEVRIGTFNHAIDLNIKNFREFPRAIEQLPTEYKNKTMVTFCTGGIRCEKAAPLLIANGFKEVYQLDGGILKYLEKCGNAHYSGECFVFDKRIALDAQLHETPTTQCHACRQPVTLDEQNMPQYVPASSCVHCIEV